MDAQFRPIEERRAVMVAPVRFNGSPSPSAQVICWEVWRAPWTALDNAIRHSPCLVDRCVLSW